MTHPSHNFVLRISTNDGLRTPYLWLLPYDRHALIL